MRIFLDLTTVRFFMYSSGDGIPGELPPMIDVEIPDESGDSSAMYVGLRFFISVHEIDALIDALRALRIATLRDHPNQMLG